MEYFRQRAKPALIGLLVGMLVGWFQPMILGVKPPDLPSRVFMTLQMGLAFTMVGLFIVNYVNVRRRAYEMYSKRPGELASAGKKDLAGLGNGSALREACPPK